MKRESRTKLEALQKRVAEAERQEAEVRGAIKERMRELTVKYKVGSVQEARLLLDKLTKQAEQEELALQEKFDALEAKLDAKTV